MTARASITVVNAGSATQTTGLGLRIARDLALVAILAIASLAAGLAVNHYSSQPLPLVYQSPEQRFDAELTTLIAAPPFKIAPAATVELSEFRAVVDGKRALILDARPSLIYEQGHVPGALNLSREDFARDYRRLGPTLKPALEQPIIVYCAGGDCHDSRLVANALLTLGFSQVRVFTGGWEAWSAARLPVTAGSSP